MLHSFEKENVVGEYHAPFFVKRRYRTYRHGSANADFTADQATKVSSDISWYSIMHFTEDDESSCVSERLNWYLDYI